MFGILAQLGEHLPYKQRVTGSSPVGPIYAAVAELADAQDLKSCCSDTVPVRFRSAAFIQYCISVEDDKYVCVAQLDRALGYGPRCRGFESSHARRKKETGNYFCLFFFESGSDSKGLLYTPLGRC